MIKTFDDLTLHGAGNAGMLAGGISEALITTEAGLAVAIPILLAHAALNRRARVLLARMDQAAMAMIEACGDSATPAKTADTAPPSEPKP